MNTPAPYRRLPGRSGLLIRHSLWMRPDHLLRVRTHPFSQDYRRYYFSDIQALMLTELSNTAEFYGYGGAALLAALTFGLWYARHEVWGGLCGLAAALLLLWSSTRPNCACYLQTRVSTERLQALRRIRSARKSLAILKTEIERVQGAAGAEVLEAYRDSAAPSIRAAAAAAGLRHYSGPLHWILFSALLVRAILAIVILAVQKYSLVLELAAGAAGAAVLLFAVVAAFQQYRTDLAPGVRWTVIAVLTWYPLSTVASFASNMYAAVQLGPKGTNPAAVVAHPVVRAYQLVDLAVLLLLAWLGIVLLWRHRRDTQTPPPLEFGRDGLGAG